MFLGVGFFVLVIRHVIAENRIRFVLGKDALSMVELPELLAAGAGYVVICVSRLLQVAHDLSRNALLLGQEGFGTLFTSLAWRRGGLVAEGRGWLLQEMHRQQGQHLRLHPAGCARHTGIPEAGAHACELA